MQVEDTNESDDDAADSLPEAATNYVPAGVVTLPGSCKCVGIPAQLRLEINQATSYVPSVLGARNRAMMHGTRTP